MILIDKDNSCSPKPFFIIVGTVTFKHQSEVNVIQAKASVTAGQRCDLGVLHALPENIPVQSIDLLPTQRLQFSGLSLQFPCGQTAHHDRVFGPMQRFNLSVEQRFLKPLLFLSVKWEADKLHRVLTSLRTGLRCKNKLNELRKVGLTERIVVVPREVEGLRYTGATKSVKKCLLDLLGG